MIIKIKIHSSCEIEDFVETHICKLCVILRSRVLRVVRLPTASSSGLGETMRGVAEKSWVERLTRDTWYMTSCRETITAVQYLYDI